MNAKLRISICLAMAIVGLAGCDRGAKKPAPPAPKATVMVPEQKEVLEYEDLPGRVEAIESVEIKARVDGILGKVAFREGTEVKKGDLLYSIDPREYQAEADSATASFEQAQAKQAQAQADYVRAQQLSKSTVIAKQDLENQGTAVLEAAAASRSAQANLAKSQLNLEYTQIRAPISGKISKTAVTEGNLVKDGDTLTTIVSQNPVYVYFEAPERSVLRWDKAVNDASKEGFAAKAKLMVGLLNEEGFPRDGKIDFTDNQLALGTGTLQMRAVVPNDDGRLRGGLFARVRLALDLPRKSLLVKERSVGVDQGQRFVYVVNAENKVEYRKVTVGQVYDGMVAVREGLNPEDRVVADGLQLLRPGQVVQPVDPVQTADDLVQK